MSAPTSAPPEIRPYDERDRAAVIALWEEAFPGDPPRNRPDAVIRRKLAVQPELFLVALRGEALVGAVLAGYDGFRGWVYHLAVRRSARRRGVGSALVRAAEDALARRGCPKLNLQVRASNREVVEFYRRLGYTLEDHLSLGKLLAGPNP